MRFMYYKYYTCKAAVLSGYQTLRCGPATTLENTSIVALRLSGGDMVAQTYQS
jgi:hypothetical protein